MKKKILIVFSIIISLFLVFIAGNFIRDKIVVNNTYKIGEANLKIPVFVYHDIVKDKSQVEYDYMQTYLDRFEEQIEWLERSGFDFITYSELEEYAEGKRELKKNSCLITFDDGYEGVYDNAYPIEKEHNIQHYLVVGRYALTEKNSNQKIKK